MKITRDLVFKIADWATRLSSGLIAVDDYRQDPDLGGVWVGANPEHTFAGRDANWAALAFYGEAGLEYAAKANVPLAMLPDWVCEALDHVAARKAAREAGVRGEAHGLEQFQGWSVRSYLRLVA